MSFIYRPSQFEIEHHGQIFAGQAYAESHGGELPATLFWERMEFRHDLNPARFDHYHENIGFILEHGGNHDPCLPQVRNWIGYMRGPSPCNDIPCVPVTPCLNPQTVPEPGSIVMASITVGLWLAAAYVLGRHESR